MSNRAPRVQALGNRAKEVMRILSLADDADLEQRIAQFIGLLGWDRVLQAATYTSRRKEGTVANPWGYTVGVINMNSARASYLHTAINWIEVGIRAGLDAALAERFGADWHKCDPPQWLDTASLGRLWNVHAAYHAHQKSRTWVSGDDQPRVRWKQDPVTQTYVPDYDSPEDFLRDLDFQPLSQMVIHGYSIASPRLAPILYNADGTQITRQTATAELRWLRQVVRNAVAHHRLEQDVFEYDAFVHIATRVEKILVALRYNCPPALARHEMKRMTVLDLAIKRLGGPGLNEMFKRVS
jgi:hypothetical protein